MKKPKKITIKHILATHLKPTVIKGENYYSVYVLICVNRTNTRQPSKITQRFKDIETLNKKEFVKISAERIAIESIIKEKLLLDNNFNLKVSETEKLKQKRSIIRRLQIRLKKEKQELLEMVQYNLF